MTEQVSFVCLNPFALRCTVWLRWCTVHCLVPSCAIVTHIERSRACNLDNIFTQPLPCLPPSTFSFKVPAALFASLRLCAYAHGCVPSLFKLGVSFWSEHRCLLGWAGLPGVYYFAPHFGPADTFSLAQMQVWCTP